MVTETTIILPELQSSAQITINKIGAYIAQKEHMKFCECFSNWTDGVVCIYRWLHHGKGPKQPWTSHLKHGKICQVDIAPNHS